MGLTKIEKIQIIGHRANEEEVVEKLQELGLVQLVKPSTPENLVLPFMAQASSVEELNAKISSLDQAIKYLEGLEVKKGLFSGFVSEKIVLSEEDLNSIISDQKKIEKIQEEVQSIQDEFNKFRTREESLKKELETILPWVNLSYVLNEVRATESTYLIPGVLPLKNFQIFQDNIKKEFEDRVALEIVNQDKEKTYLLIAFLKEDADKFKPADYNWTTVELPPVKKLAKERIEEIKKELDEIYTQRAEVKKRAEMLGVEKVKLMAFYDYLSNTKKKMESKKQFFYFPHAFILEGWIRKKDIKKITEDLEEKFKEIEIFTVKPQKGEEPPVSLENNRLVKPFEMLTRMYGMPNSKELDPTPFLLPFFVIYFGFCITDAGYGVVIALLSYFLIRRAKGKANALIYILFWGGLLTIFAGAITGGWFGDAIDKFSVLSFLSGLKKFMLFDPMKNPMIFLIISLILGFIQICYGLIIKVYKLARQGLLVDAIFDPFSTLMIMLGIPLLLLSFVNLLPDFLLPVCVIMLIFGFVNIFYYSFKNAEGNLLIRLFLGFYSIYSALTGCLLGDVLSYSRILALGLATSGIALAVNVIAQFVLDIPFIGIILAIVVFLGGHIFNIVLQAFGGFVHSMRLQYVEFFTKFYDDGGEEFRPFSKEYKYIGMKT